MLPPRLFYGPGQHQVGELRRASGRSHGVVMIVHGGFWRAGRTLDMTAPAATALAAFGFDTWNVEYRRGGQGGWANTLTDIASAFDHLDVFAEVPGLDLDLDRVLLFGHSAGGQLAAWCAGRSRADGAGSKVGVRGLVTAGAVLDLAAGAGQHLGDGAVTEFLGGGPAERPADYAEADPLQRIPLGVPTRCVHSVHDERVPYAQSEAYVAAALEAGDDARLIPATGAHTDAIEVRHPDFELVADALAELA